MNSGSGNDGSVIPFGKYKGQPSAVLMNDPKYVEWLNGQGWVKDKYPQFYTVIINNFQEPNDTPEHNELQAMFLDDTFCAKFMTLAMQQKGEFRFQGLNSKQFEMSGVDVSLSVNGLCLRDYIFRAYQSDIALPEGQLVLRTLVLDCGIEVKPSIGDDFPAVLRQVRNMKRRDYKCVLYRDFVATSVNIDQVRAMFRHADIYLLSLDDVLGTTVHTIDENHIGEGHIVTKGTTEESLVCVTCNVRLI